ncbi:MAG: hypothetical protein IT186_03690 [Acidobacteria bacterium]|nr:hypothetical protein [Acidobacteriota bacterium]MCG3193092.1 hypothetical protein [Thermoanaerobaculia bacterium]MCK6680820.1 hypothetical protein [Thermoanaerobaculia bacterium]
MKPTLLSAAFLALLACSPSAGPQPGTSLLSPVPVVRLGRERSTAFPYQEPHAQAKAALLRQINWERRANGAPELLYDPRGARVGDEFCLDSIANRTAGHWDLAGRAPYLRWALLGGVDYHAQNFASRSESPGPLKASMEKLLLDSHALFMAEKPPNDGHRKTVLDPSWTHVGIGAAAEGGELRMTEEYSRQELEWIELPARPLASGETATFAGKLPPGWNLLAVDICYERPPQPMTRARIAALNAYGYPPTVRKLRAKLSTGQRYGEGGTGDIDVSPAGIFRVSFVPGFGRGHYYILTYAGPGNIFGRPLTPVTGALIRVE